MFCPRCSQEQNSQNLRYCSRCGLPLDIVSEVVDLGGNPERLFGDPDRETIFTRRNGLLASLIWFILFIVFIIPLLLMSNVGEELIVMTAMIGMFGSIFLFIVSLFLGKSGKSQKGTEHKVSGVGRETEFVTNSAVGSLDAANSIPAKDFVSPVIAKGAYETGQMTPSSVVEETTKLLKKEVK